MSTPFREDFLKGRAALITGGGTGIGRGLALALAEAGCDVAITSRRMEHLMSTAQEIRAAGVRAHAVAGDVRNAADVDHTVGGTIDALGRLDILINAAAGNFICLAENLSPNGFGAVVDIDLKGTFNVTKAAFPHLKASAGTVINVSATLHYLATLGQVHVSAAKAGIDALTRVLAAEWGPYGIRVNGIAPGPTEGTEGARRLTSDATRFAAAAECPLGRMTSIADIAGAALFLCSEAASFVTGVTLVVDGGLWLRSARILDAAGLEREL
jgi:peroxisomal 2,4-dienoyl-CoA reductase